MLPAIIKKFFSPQIVLKDEDSKAIAIAQVKALAEVSNSFKQIAEFVTGEGLKETLKGNARYNAVNAALSGLTSNAGRMGLNAATMKQDAIDTVHRVEEFHKTYERVIAERNNGEEFDEEIYSAEELAKFNK
ncbi:hypothetical protein [uncultured Flavobacterium sp.]|uniref:hypothetical protein n=1 Tax=uncultured Flavobacterium sp. TaxID=165435 RepID=UPI0025982E0A|nr:hypothetical protein [uncultured Flavobacterium sp.]